MIHGGLQGAFFTALATFEERLDSKASSTRVDGLVTGTNACYDKSTEACQAVKQLVTLGSISKVVALEHELHDMSARTRVLETTLDRASKLVEDLSAYVANLAGPGSGAAASGVWSHGQRIPCVQGFAGACNGLHPPGTQGGRDHAGGH